MPQNQPRNPFGLRVFREGRKPWTYWSPSASARADVWAGLLRKEDVTHLEAVGAGTEEPK